MLALYLVILFAPMVLLLVGSFGASWTNTLLPSGATLAWYEQLISDASFRRAFVVSLQVTTLACIITALVALPMAYTLYRSASQRIAFAVRLIAMLPIAVPALVLAFGFILIFSSDVLPFLGSIWLLTLGHVVLILPYMLQTLITDMRHYDLATLERAAESLGAGTVRRFIDIVVPTLRYSVFTGLIMSAAISIGEFQFSNLVAGFLSRPYPVVLLQAFYGATGFACAATIVLLVLATLAALAGAATARSTSGAAALSA